MAAHCPSCGEAVERGAGYCPSCGTAFEASEQAATPYPKAHGTLPGMPSPPPSGPPPAEGSSPEPAPPAQDSSAARNKPTKRTMIGMPAVAQPYSPGSAPQQAGAAHSAASGGAHADHPGALGKGGTKRGMPAPEPPAAHSAGSATEQAHPASREAAKGRTMLGVPAAVPPPGPRDGAAPQQPAPRRPASFPAVAEEDWQPRSRRMAHIDEELPSRGSSRKALAWIVAMSLVLLVAAGGAVYVWQEDELPVRADVVREDGREWLRLQVPGAREGAKLRFGGQEKPLDAGQAKFPLASGSLAVGDNLVTYDVIDADGDVHSGSLTLEVPYRIRADLEALSSSEPAIDIVVAAKPGTHVTLDGEPLTLDAQGRAVRSYPLEPTSASKGWIEHVVRYRIEPPQGEPAVDELRTRLPLTSMQIDRPGLDVVTEKPHVEIAGAVGPSTEVSVDGDAVDVRDGRFVDRVELPEPGAYEVRVVARAPGKAPYVQTLQIRRVEDLREAARDFQADADLSYARLAQNPNIYRGRKVAFEGRVYNVDVQGGRSVLQLLVRECPDGQRCPLWVEHSAATDATVNTWLRVLGTVAGEQQFRSEAENVVTVPKVEARYLLPVEP